MKKCMNCMRDYDEQFKECPVCGFTDKMIEEERKEYKDSLPPETILKGRYIVGCVQSYTEYSITYIAWDALLQKKVIIKEFFPIFGAIRNETDYKILKNKKKKNVFEEGREAFEEEAELICRNQEIRGFINIYRTFRENGTSYAVYEYIEGYTLLEHIETKGVLSETLADEVLQQIMSVLQELHKRNIYHWNLSPDNIYIDSANEIRLLDPGMAKKVFYFLIKGDMEIYMNEFIAPELIKGKPTGPAADLYSLGALYYYMLTGTEPRENGILINRAKKLKTEEQNEIVKILMAESLKIRPKSIDDFRKIYDQIKKEKMR